MTNGDKSCTNCVFFVAEKGNPKLGICRRYPSTQHRNMQLSHIDWCGEYKRAGDS